MMLCDYRQGAGGHGFIRQCRVTGLRFFNPKGRAEMRTIAVINQKGGCGKTTTAINLGACLAFKFNRVLIVDMDPQGHATLGLGITPGTYPNSVFHLLAVDGGRPVGAEDAVIPLTDRLHLIPSDVVLSAAEPVLMGREHREYCLADALAQVEKSYDFAIIDCPPNIGILTFNALFACTEVIIPLETGLFAMHGLARLLETVDLVNARRSPEIRAGILLTMFDRRTRIARESLDEITKHMNGLKLDTIINMSVRLKEAAGYGEPIIVYAPGSSGARDYLDLAEEVLGMTGGRREAKKAVKAGKPVQDVAEVMFTLHAPDARKVYVVADFNGWKVGQAPMEQASGLWKLSVPLKKGAYEYKFHVDGEWVTDPGNPKTRRNELGENSYLKVD
jgi:chromosome partitioning protein